MYKLAQGNIPNLLSRLAEAMPLYIPMRREDETVVQFAPWTGMDCAEYLCTDKTTLSPKGFFFPADENLYETVAIKTKKDALTYKITPASIPDAPFTLFGVRACDDAAINMLDKVFLSESTDISYKTRREASYIITLACEAPVETCFCTAFDIDFSAPGGDVRTWMADGFLYWLALTEKGEVLTTKIRSILSPTSEEKEFDNMLPEHKNPLPTNIIRKFSIRFHSGTETDDETCEAKENLPLALFHSPAWEQAHQACVACGTCTFLCPTCHCYDIAYEEDINAGAVHCQRRWDVCLYPTFTQMAHGNPRPTKKERFRQRFMHKLIYFRQKHGVFGCVGCGRCVSQCPANVNIVNVARTLLRASGGVS